MPLQTPSWDPLTQWYHHFGNQTEDFVNQLSRPRERTLSTPNEHHYHISAPHQIIWIIAHWLNQAGYLTGPGGMPSQLSKRRETIHHIPVNPSPYWVDCTGDIHEMQHRAVAILRHYEVHPDTFHVGNQAIPGASYSDVHTDLQRERDATRKTWLAASRQRADDTSYHQALDISISAMRHARNGDQESARRLYAVAYAKSVHALADTYQTHPNDPNFSRYLIATNAGWCAVNAGMRDEAFNMAHVAGLAAVDLNRSIPDQENPEIIPLLTGDPRRILNAAAAALAHAQHIPPRLQLEPAWLKHFMSTLDERQQLPPGYLEQSSEQHWLKLAAFIIDQAAADGRITELINQYAEEYLDDAYPVN